MGLTTGCRRTAEATAKTAKMGRRWKRARHERQKGDYLSIFLCPAPIPNIFIISAPHRSPSAVRARATRPRPEEAHFMSTSYSHSQTNFIN